MRLLASLRSYKRDVEEHHPIQECPPLPLERRVQSLERHLARLWDEVWWLQLPAPVRWFYRWQGFRSPIERFYEDAD